MKRIVYFLIFVLIIFTVSCSDTLKNVRIEEMLSKPDEGSLALITMKDANSRTGTVRAYEDLHTMTVFTDGNYIPLIFRLSNNKIASLKATDAVTFDKYILAPIDQVIIYKGRIDETNINEYIDGNKLNCRYIEKKTVHNSSYRYGIRKSNGSRST